MKKLTLAAALAAGMTTIAVAQEAPANAERMQAVKPMPVEAQKTQGKPTETQHAVTFADRGMIVFTPNEKQKGADKKQDQKVASTGGRPDLVIKHRNSGSASMVATQDAKAVAKVSGSGGRYGNIVAKYASAYGVPVALAHAVIRIESNYRVNARGSAGEVGLMQIKPSTARGMGYSGSVKALYNPDTNIKYGMKYLGMAHKLGGGTTCGTILKYNAGHGAKRMNKISAAYCSKVKRHLGA